MHIARQPVELRDDDRAAQRLGLVERRLELRATIESVGPLAGLYFLTLGGDLAAMARGEG
jgi:hypothetical protein